MRPKDPRAKPPWGKRVLSLLKASGLPREQWKVRFGTVPGYWHKDHWSGIYGIISGTVQPSVEFVRALRQAEQEYAEELEYFECGAIITRGVPGRPRYERYDGRCDMYGIPWRELRQKPNRAEDCAALDALGAVGKNRGTGFGYRKDGSPPRYVAPAWVGNMRPVHREHESGRPKVVGGGPR